MLKPQTLNPKDVMRCFCHGLEALFGVVLEDPGYCECFPRLSFRLFGPSNTRFASEFVLGLVYARLG